MTTYALVCDTVNPPQLSVSGDGSVLLTCNGQASYRDVSSLPNSSWFLPPITQAEMYELGSALTVLFVIAFGLRMVRRNMEKK